jgi:hypothetical protein
MMRLDVNFQTQPPRHPAIKTCRQSPISEEDPGRITLRAPRFAAAQSDLPISDPHGCCPSGFGKPGLNVHTARKAEAMGRRAARIAGNNPPIKPSTAAVSTATSNSAGVTANAKVT